MKKFIGIVLCVCLLIGVAAPAAYACDCPYDPIVYVHGKHELYFKNDDGSYVLDENGEPMNITDRPLDIGELAKALIPEFINAYLTDSWDAYSEKMLSYILPLYDGIGVDSDGMPIDTVNIGNDDVNIFGWYEGTTHGYHMGWNNTFDYDYRMSPVDIAAQLNDFIEQVKQRTGHNKVVIVARCQGANILMSYLQQYQENAAVPFNSVSKVMLLDGCMNGLDYLEALFSGNINPSTESLYRLLNGEYDISELLGDEVGEYLELLVDSLKETYGLEVTVRILKRAYEKLKDSLFAPWFRAFYATCGANLACVRDDFDETIDYIFPTDELKEQNSGLIEKAVYTNKNVTVRATEILKKAQSNGVSVGIIGEYGFQSTPLSPEADYCGDTMTSLVNQTFGATCSKVQGTLDESYIASQTEKGLGRYISADKQVDASTCAFPETTWIIRNAKHEFSESIHVLVVMFLREGYTVSNQSGYPQFLNYTQTDNGDGLLSPLKESNPNDIDWDNTISGVEDGKATQTLIEKIVAWFRSLLDKLMGYVDFIKNSFK